jgi:hypothetical protein
LHGDAPTAHDDVSTGLYGQLRPRHAGGTVRNLIRVSVLVTALVVGAAVPASADDVYHTERLEFTSASDSDFHGQIINIHANGPVIGALERYQVVRAAPQTSYDVWIQMCTDAGFVDFIPTAELVTNRQGNGHAQATFTAQDLEPFSGAVVSIRWVLRSGNADVYTTACTTVTID